MALEQKLSLKLAQKLVMTPSLQQAIKLLQMTRLELEGVVSQELMENPLLEESENQLDEAPATEAGAEEGQDQDVAEAMSDVDVEAFFSEFSEPWESGARASLPEPREGAPLENTLSREPDLYDHLLEQVHLMELPEGQREIAELIVGNLSPEGFLMASVEELRALGAPDDAPLPVGDDEEAQATLTERASRGYSRDDVEAALDTIRSLDPPGIACTSLRESLLYQLRARGVGEGDLVYRAVDETWDLFKHRKFEAAAKALNVQLAELEPVVEAIRQLDTRPGRQYSSESTQYVEPDVYVVRVGDNYVIQLNDDGMPRLRVSRAYRKMLQALREEGSQNDAQQYIKDKMRSAIWLIKSLDQRQRTIYKVATSIVHQQRAFLDYGLDHLRPMVLRDVAEDIEMHESTVSRVVSNKYMHTPRGLFPLKFFFHSGIDREYGGDISSLSVKRKIKQMIQEEDPRKPLSDSELMRTLKREGIQIARRTVAKYRDELGIASSTERKQIF